MNFYFICIFLCFINFCVCYQRFKIQSYDLCPLSGGIKLVKLLQDGVRLFNNDANIVLTENINSAAIIEQTWNSTTIQRTKSSCVFEVGRSKSNKKSNVGGLYTVVAQMNLRKDAITGACIDYVVFSGGGREPSGHICGHIGDGLTDEGEKLLFDQRKDKVRIYVYIDKNLPVLEPLELSLTITAYGPCTAEADFYCDLSDHSCIYRGFVNDDRINCMPPCLDEGECFKKTVSLQVIDRSSIAISALTSLVFTMVGVAACFWLCWKYKECCCNTQRNDAAARNNRNEPVIELPSLGSQNDNSHGTAPEDTPTKDLPPSYDELFPER